MHRGTAVYRFGPWEFDPARRLLFGGQMRVRLSDPQAAILAHLCAHAGQVVSKETLIKVGWGGMAVSDNSVDQVISRLRKILGDRSRDATYTETFPHEGYRFKSPVQEAGPATREITETTLEKGLAPYRAFMDGEAQLYTLNRDALQRARHAFEEAVHGAPAHAEAHVGLAMACALAFEATTADAQPDVASLQVGIDYARKATVLDPGSGGAWSTLAFVLYLNGNTQEAGPAAHLAVTLEPHSWRHSLRAAYVTWGQERLDAARRALALCPGMALAHWLAATVFIARGAFDSALDELRRGCAAQDKQTPDARFSAVGLHLQHGLVLAAHDRLDEAEAALKRELSWADSGQLYARQCAANTWYALGAVLMRQRKRADAEAAFNRALTISPGHIPATAALKGEAPPLPGPPKDGGHYVVEKDAALGQAIALARGNRHDAAARVYREAVAQAPPGPTGWLLAVEPVINPLAHRDEWDDVLAMIRVRAA